MPMRGELAIPATRAAWAMRDAQSTLLQVFGIFRTPDLIAVTVFAVIGLLAAACLTLLLPLSDEVVTFLAQVS